MITLGLADKDGTAANALVKDGNVLYVSDSGIEDMLLATSTYIEQVESICYFEKPVLRLERVVESHLAAAPRRLGNFRDTMPDLFKETVFKRRDILQSFRDGGMNIAKDKIIFSDHITSLCAEAFYPSPHEQAAILCLDDAGEWSGTAIAIGDGNKISIERELSYPHSLGLLMAAFASYLDVPREHLGVLAEKGQPTYARVMARKIIDLKPDGSFCLNQMYFDYAAGGNWTNAALHELLGGTPREAGTELQQKHYNIAASIMAIVTQAVSLMIHSITRDFRGIHNLCVAGKLAQEKFIIERIKRDHAFDHVDIRPDAGNKALAIGAALSAFYLHHEKPRDVMFHRNLPTAIAK